MFCTLLIISTYSTCQELDLKERERDSLMRFQKFSNHSAEPPIYIYDQRKILYEKPEVERETVPLSPCCKSWRYLAALVLGWAKRQNRQFIYIFLASQ